MVLTDLQQLKIPTYNKTVRGITVEVNGLPVGLAGVIHTSPNFAFSKIDEELRSHPKLIMSVVHCFNEFLQQYYTTVYATADKDETNAPAILQRMGFKYYQTNLQGDVFRWQRQRLH